MKKIVKNALASFLLVFSLLTGSASIAVSSVSVANAASCGEGSISGQPLENAVNCAQPQGTADKLFGDGGIFTTVTNILVFLVGIIAVVMLIIGGIRYALSGGDQTAVTSAKNTILYAIIGLVVAFLAFAIVSFVTSQLKQGTDGTASSLHSSVA